LFRQSGIQKGNIVWPEIIRIKSFHGTPKTSLRKRSFTRFFLKSVHCRAGTAVAQSIYHDQVHAGVAYFSYNEVLVQGLMCLYLLIASVYFALTTYGPVVCRLVFRAERRARAPESVIAVNIVDSGQWVIGKGKKGSNFFETSLPYKPPVIRDFNQWAVSSQTTGADLSGTKNTTNMYFSSGMVQESTSLSREHAF
jgi:hypothetical protein